MNYSYCTGCGIMFDSRVGHLCNAGFEMLKRPGSFMEIYSPGVIKVDEEVNPVPAQSNRLYSFVLIEEDEDGELAAILADGHVLATDETDAKIKIAVGQKIDPTCQKVFVKAF